MEEKLTKLQAYNAMIIFLEAYYKSTRSDDIGAFWAACNFCMKETPGIQQHGMIGLKAFMRF